MNRYLLKMFFLLSFSLGFAQSTVLSPNDKLKIQFQLSEQGMPQYEVFFKNQLVVKKSSLGLKLKDESKQLMSQFMVDSVKMSKTDETWKPVLGANETIRNQYQEMKVFLTQKRSGLKLNLVFKVFNEGIAFRYEIPTQSSLNYFVIADEMTHFHLTSDYNSFWIPGDYDSQEYAYNETLLSKIDAKAIDMNNGIGMKGPIDSKRVQSPLMMKGNGMYVNIFEAAVRNYPIMHLDLKDDFLIKSHLVPNAIGDKAYMQTPANTPWRTIFITDNAKEILGSDMILNLNEPSKIENTSWIKPMKYVGIWWEMHVGTSTWDYAGSQNGQNLQPNELKATGKHGATTKNTKRYIDFAAKHGFDGVLIEGWNVGWEDWFGNWKENVFDFVTPYPDFDIQEVTKYAASKNVKLIMHHETSGSVANYERRLDRAFKFMKDYKYDAVKTGYVGKIIPRGEWHDGQTMVNHFEHVLQRAADFEIMINSHESVRPTGLHRTYPNFIASEAARGNEFNAWSVGNPPMHETILPFTRLLGGPMDYTPGIFEIKMSHYDASKTEQVHTTLAKQLALYVTMYSPLQMAADLPENYERYLDAFQFIKDVPADWSKSIVLEAEPGDYVTYARKDKNSERWFLGAITDEEARETTLVLDFLDANKKYEATIYEDGKDADWEKNPKSYNIRKMNVSAKTKLKLKLANGGGAAISIVPISQ
jgi:hypothetical protein